MTIQEKYKELSEMMVQGVSGWSIIKSEARVLYADNSEKIAEIPVIYKLIENGTEVSEDDFKMLTDPVLAYKFPKTRKLPIYSEGENPVVLRVEELVAVPSEEEFEFLSNIKNLIKKK